MVSILMPAKNAGKFLEECLQSIINQSYTQWELLAVDDHSTDNTFKNLVNFSKKDSRIKVFKNKGIGIIPALRTAYENASGEMVTRMDADDIMSKEKLDVLVHFLEKNGRGNVITGKVQYFSDESLSEGYIKYQNWLNSLSEKNTHWKEIYKECVIASPCWMVFKEDLDKCEAFKPNRYPEDYDLVFRFYSNKLKVIASDQILHLWRDHSLRTSRNHAHYAAQSFYELKLHYFLKLEYDIERPIVLWGAGTKGKRMAKLLQKNNIPFTWVSNNPKKHGKEIYEQLMYDFKEIVTKNNPQIIVTVALRNAKSEINKFLVSQDLKQAVDYWFFS